MASTSNSDRVHSDNALEKYKDELIIFFHLDKGKIQGVIDVYNQHGGNVSYVKLNKITGLDIGGDVLIVRDALSYIAHQYLHHKEIFEEDLRTAKVPKLVIDGSKDFVQKLNKKALQGLDLIHFTRLMEIDRPMLVGIGHTTNLSEIKDEDGNFVGYVPIMRMRFTFLDEENKSIVHFIQMPVDKFQTIIESFEIMKRQAVDVGKRFREKLGDSVVLVGDD